MLSCFTLVLTATSCGIVRNADDSPCKERCRYNYSDCAETSQTGTIHFTFSIGENSEDSAAANLTSDYCTRKYNECKEFCDKQNKVTGGD